MHKSLRKIALSLTLVFTCAAGAQNPGAQAVPQDTAPAFTNSTVSGPLKVGQRMADGAIYVGVSPTTRRPMYASPADEPLTLTFNAAKERAQQRSKETGKAYRVPSEKELTVLFNKRTFLGGFPMPDTYPYGWYWSSKATDKDVARCVRLGDGYAGNSLRDWKLSVRLVRN